MSLLGLGMLSVGLAEELSNIPRPDTPGRKNIMCPGCKYRLLGKDVIYCEKKGKKVISGKTFSGVYDYEDYETEGELEYDQCIVRNDKTAYICFTCDGCGDCIRKTGCTAIWQRGFAVRIDPSMCTGCGMCSEYCKKEAIEWKASLSVASDDKRRRS